MNLEPLITMIKKHGLEQHQQTILATARPAISINLGKKGQGKVGQSRMGGYPDLPASLPWPTDPLLGNALCFILQLNLAELPTFSENPLPTKGMLYLFLDEDEDHAQQLIIYLGDEPLKLTQLPKDTDFITDWYEDLIAHRLTFSLFADLPRWASSDHSELAERINIEIDGEDALSKVINSLLVNSDSYTGRDGIGKLLGHVSGIGHDPREDAYVVREVNPEWLYNYKEREKLDMAKAKHWQNLLEFHSEDKVNLMFGDAGYLQILIQENDLEKRDFSRVYVNLESS
jgi:uncharacterized protein YwqG